MEKELNDLDGQFLEAYNAMVKAEDTWRGVGAEITEKRAMLDGESDKELKDLDGKFHKAYRALTDAEDTWRGVGAKVVEKRAELAEKRQHM